MNKWPLPTITVLDTGRSLVLNKTEWNFHSGKRGVGQWQQIENQIYLKGPRGICEVLLGIGMPLKVPGILT